jgi:hypothetical protein
MKTGLSPSIFETKQHTFNCWAMARRFLTGVDAEPSPRRCRAHRTKSGERFDASSCAETPTSISYNLLSIARRALFNDRNRLHFDQQIWVGQAPYFDRGTGGEGPKGLRSSAQVRAREPVASAPIGKMAARKSVAPARAKAWSWCVTSPSLPITATSAGPWASSRSSKRR